PSAWSCFAVLVGIAGERPIIGSARRGRKGRLRGLRAKRGENRGGPLPQGAGQEAPRGHGLYCRALRPLVRAHSTKRTYQPKKRKRAKTHGFRARSRTRS